MKVRTATWLIAIALAAPVAEADQTSGPLSTLTSGDRVRLQLAGTDGSLRATIESATADELVLRPQGAAEPLRLGLAQLQSLEVARGRSSHWLKGAAIGFMPGALLGGLVGARSTCYPDDNECFNGGLAVVGALTGGIVTASVGALIGLAFRTDRWVRVHERKPKVALVLAPAKGQVRGGLSVGF